LTSQPGSACEPPQPSVVFTELSHESRSVFVRLIIDATEASARICADADLNALSVHEPPAIMVSASLPPVPWPRPTMSSTYEMPSFAAVRRTSAIMSAVWRRVMNPTLPNVLKK
jgi:hypothetical protein